MFISFSRLLSKSSHLHSSLHRRTPRLLSKSPQSSTRLLNLVPHILSWPPIVLMCYFLQNLPPHFSCSGFTSVHSSLYWIIPIIWQFLTTRHYNPSPHCVFLRDGKLHMSSHPPRVHLFPISEMSVHATHNAPFYTRAPTTSNNTFYRHCIHTTRYSHLSHIITEPSTSSATLRPFTDYYYSFGLVSWFNFWFPCSIAISNSV